MIRYFTSKKAATDHLKATGWQRDDDQYGANWFRYPRPGDTTKYAHVGRSSKTKGLWAVNYND